jgi:hypothetical protein
VKQAKPPVGAGSDGETVILVSPLQDLVPGEATRVHGSVPIAVFNADGELHAIDETCTPPANRPVRVRDGYIYVVESAAPRSTEEPAAADADLAGGARRREAPRLENPRLDLLLQELGRLTTNREEAGAQGSPAGRLGS